MKLRFPPRTSGAHVEIPLTEPLLITLTENTGKLPSGFVYELPRYVAEMLIHGRRALAVGHLGTFPDLTLTEEECREADVCE